MPTNKESRARILRMIAFLLANLLIHALFNDSGWTVCIRSQLTGLWLFIWIQSIRRRVIFPYMRRYFYAVWALLIIMCMAQAIKFDYSLSNQNVERYAWYAYYIAFIMVPMLCFRIAISLGEKEEKRRIKKRFFLWIPACLLLLGVMTNDIHQACFRFKTPIDNNVPDYTYGNLYIIIVVWMVTMFTAAVVLVCKRCMVEENKKYFWVPVLPLVIMSLLFILDVFAGSILPIGNTNLISVTEVFCYSIPIFLECIIRTGLLPINDSYEVFFRESHISAKILDNTGRTVFQTDNQFDAERENLIFRSKDIPGGRIVWAEDMTEIEKNKETLSQIQEHLVNEKVVLNEEVELKKNQAILEVYNRIYDAIPKAVDKQIGELRTLLDRMDESEDFYDDMYKACLLNAYIKRRSNLMIISDGVKDIPVEELYLSIRELMEYLRIRDVRCEVFFKADFVWEATDIMSIWDYVENVVEATFGSLTSLFVALDGDSRTLKLRIMLNGEWDMEPFAAKGCTYSCLHDSDETNISIVLEKEVAYAPA